MSATIISKDDTTLVICLSSDIATLDTTELPNATMLYCMDTNLTAFLDSDNSLWRFTDTSVLPAYIAPADDDDDDDDEGGESDGGEGEGA